MSIKTKNLDNVVIRFAGDSGDGMQLTGTRFTETTAIVGNDLSTLPDYPAEIRAPAGSLAGVSAFQLHFSSKDIHTPGDTPDVLVAMNPAALKVHLSELLPGGIIIVNENAELNMLPFYGNIKEVFRIGSNCLINNLNLKDEIPHYINKNKIKNSLFLFSASSLSNVVIHHCYLANPENIYFDIGSTLNPLMKGMEGWKYNRDYLKNYWMNGKSQIGDRICVW